MELKKLESDARRSIDLLGVKSLDVFYIHAPDDKYPLEQTLQVLDKLHQDGLFKRLGLSNFKKQDIEKAYEISSKQGWIKPSVYQGNYNAFARHAEKGLLPTL